MTEDAEIQTISFENVGFSYENEPVINELTWSVGIGEHLVLKGESGSGKSTILQLVLGFYQPSSGEIQIRTEDGRNLSPVELRNRVAWLPQETDLGDGTVKEIVDFLFSFEHNKSRAPDSDRIKSTMETLSLSPDLYTKSLSNLSTGQRQRIGAVICASLDRPVLLLDEPTAALDRQNKTRVADLLLDGPGRIILSTSHDSFWLDRATSIVEIE